MLSGNWIHSYFYVTTHAIQVAEEESWNNYKVGRHLGLHLGCTCNSYFFLILSELVDKYSSSTIVYIAADFDKLWVLFLIFYLFQDIYRWLTVILLLIWIRSCICEVSLGFGIGIFFLYCKNRFKWTTNENFNIDFVSF